MSDTNHQDEYSKIYERLTINIKKLEYDVDNYPKNPNYIEVNNKYYIYLDTYHGFIESYLILQDFNKNIIHLPSKNYKFIKNPARIKKIKLLFQKSI